MSFVYTPNATNNPTTYTCPSDGDPDAAATFNVPFNALMDKAAYIGAMFKMAAVASSTTILVTSPVAGSYSTVVTATFASPISILATDVIVAIGNVSLLSGSGSNSDAVHSVLTYSGGTTRQLDAVDTTTQGSTLTYISCPYVWTGSTAAATAATSVSLALKISGSTATTESVALFVAVLRAG